MESRLVSIVRPRLWWSLPHLVHVHLALNIGIGWWLDLLLLLLLLLRLGAVGVCWRRHSSGSGHGIASVRVRRGSEIRMGKCFSGGDTLGGVKLQQAFQEVDRCGPISIQRLRVAR